MKSSISSFARWLVAATVLVTVPTVVPAQEKAAAKSLPAQKAKKKRAKPRGRLPAYFARVVSALQREKIYAIQGKYRKQIDMLKEQLDGLYQQRDKEVFAVLTDEQRTKVAEYQEAGRKRRVKRSKAKTAARGNTKDRNK